MLARNGICIAALPKSDRPIAEIDFSEGNRDTLVFRRSATISPPDTFKPEPISNADWDRGISRGSENEALMADSDFGRLLIKKGDEVQVSPNDRRVIASIKPA